MAEKKEQLAIDIIAKLNNLEKQMAKASGITARAYREMSLNSRRATKQMENDAIRSSVRINQALASINGKVGAYSKAFGAGIVAKVSLGGAQNLLDSATRIHNALKVAGLEGAELTRVYDALYASAQRNAAPLEVMAGLYSKLALQQKELGISQAELLNFTDKVALALRVAGTDTQAASGALLQLSQALGSGIVRAEEFNSVLEGAPTIAQAVARGLRETGGSVAKLRQLVVDGKVSSEAFFRAFEAGAVVLEDQVASSQMTVSQGFERLKNVAIDAAREFDNNSDAASLLNKFLKDMGELIQDVGGWVAWATKPLSELADFLNQVTESANNASAALGRMVGADKIGQALGAAPKGSPNYIQNRIDAAFDDGNVKGDRLTPTVVEVNKGKPIRTVSIADYKVPEKEKVKKAKAAKSHSKTTSQQIDDDIQSIVDRTTALQAEIQMVGLSYQEQEKRRVALDLEQAALAKLRDEAIKKGQADLSNIKLSEDQRAKIDAISEAYAKQADQLRVVQEQQERVDQASEDFYNSFKSGFTDAITGAKSLSDALSDILKKLGEMLLNTAFDALFKPASGGAGGGMFGNIFSGIGSLITGKYADGTNFATGGLSLVGERGPELVNLRRGAQVIPNHKIGEGIGGSEQSITVPVNVNIDATGADPAGLERVKSEVARLKREIPSLVVENVRRISRQNIRI